MTMPAARATRVERRRLLERLRYKLGSVLFPRLHNASAANSVALALLNSLQEPLAFVVRQDAQLILSGGSPALERLVGRSSAELAGLALARLLEEGETACTMVSGAMQQGVAARFRAQAIDRFGVPTPVTVRVEPIDLPGRDSTQALIYLDPLDAELEGLRMLAARFRDSQDSLKKQAVHLGKMQQDLTAFGSMLSHDLRAPLRTIDGFAHILAEDHADQLDPLARGHLDRILNSSARMNRMIDALRDLSLLTARALTLVPVDITGLAHDVAEELMQSDADSLVRLEVQEGLAATGDPAMLRLLLQNLLANALKFSGRQVAPLVQVGTLGQSKGQHTFYVRDNGAGFDMRFSERLFGLFERLHTTEDFPGTGVGLATARQIVRRHGGELWARGKVGQGACFYFSLPAA